MVKVRLKPDLSKRRLITNDGIYTKEWTTLTVAQALPLTGSLELDFEFENTDEDDLLQLPDVVWNMLSNDFGFKKAEPALMVKSLLPAKKSGLKTITKKSAPKPKPKTTAKPAKETVE